MKRALFIFRQDLRVQDNMALYKAISDGYEVCPVFIFDTNVLQYSPEKDPRLGFLIEALADLEKQLEKIGSWLGVYHGDPVTLIPELMQEWKCDAIYHNRSYGTGSLTRDHKIAMWCRDEGVPYRVSKDYLLVEPQEVEARKVFTPFFKKRKLVEKAESLPALEKILSPKLTHQTLQEISPEIDAGENTYWPVDAWKKRLQEFAFADYHDTRNLPAIDGSSRISPYIRFGLLSIRQLYHAVKNISETYVSEIAWREFWCHIMYHFPETRMLEFQQWRRDIKRKNQKELFTHRCEGTTGYPLVDAGMRQLKQEGRMHNRVRMVVASFLTKDLLIDWRWGEEWFRKYLIDYDENVNIGNWQRSASVGPDPKPLRIFNPCLQSERFDKDAIYIKKYIPELADTDPKIIHKPLDNDLGYAKPVVDHYIRSKEAKERYNEAKYGV